MKFFVARYVACGYEATIRASSLEKLYNMLGRTNNLSWLEITGVQYTINQEGLIEEERFYYQAFTLEDFLNNNKPWEVEYV